MIDLIPSDDRTSILSSAISRYKTLTVIIYPGLLIIATLDLFNRNTPTGPLLNDYREWQYILSMVSLAVLFAIDFLTVRRTQFRLTSNQVLAQVCLRFVLITIVQFTGTFERAIFAYFLLILFASLVAQRWVSISIACLGFVGFVVRFSLGPRNNYLSTTDWLFLLAYVLSVVIIMFLAHLIVEAARSRLKLQSVLADLETSHQQLQVYAAEVAELATTEERNRLARDIHDGLGHYLAAVNVQLEMAIKLREKNPAGSLTAMTQAKQAAHEALQDVRLSVGTLRESAQPFELNTALNTLVTRMNNDQLQISFRVEGQQNQYSQQTLLVLYRAAQEGLTNIYKHAQATRASLWVQFSKEQARLRIVDDGVGYDDQQEREGYGLQGLVERISQLGGVLNIEGRPDEGTVVDITLPASVV